MRELLALIVAGLVGGGLAAMLATSLVTTYTATGIFNIAQGSVAFLSAYAFLELDQAAGLPKPLAAAVTVLIVAPGFGLLLEKLVYRRLSQAPELARIVGTVGLALAIPAFVIILIDYLSEVPGLRNHVIPVELANPIPLGPDPSKVWSPGLSIVITSDQVIVLCATAITAIVYWLIVRHTRLGLEMRAVVDGYGLATIRGISYTRVSRFSWALSFGSAGLVGVCGAVSLGNDPDAFLELLFIAASAAVLARLRSIPLAMVFALLTGVAEKLVTGYLQSGPLAKVQGLGSTVPFVGLLLGLYLMSRRGGRVAGTTAVSDAPVELTRPRRNAVQRTHSLILFIVGVVLIAFFFGNYWNQFVGEGLAFAVIYLSLVVLVGQLGVATFAQAGFVSCGGLLSGWIAYASGLPIALAAILAALAAVAISVIVALPALKLSGLQLALATLAAAYILNDVVFQVPAVQGEQAGGWAIDRPDISWLNLTSNTSFALSMLVVFVVFALIVRNFQLSQIGRRALAVRGSRPAATSSGVSTARVVIYAFAVSGFLAGIGGFFLAESIGQVSWTQYPPLTGLTWIAIAVTIGVRRPTGALVAGITTPFAPQLLGYITTNTQWGTLLFGMGAIALSQFPGGILDLHTAQGVWLRERLLPGRALDWLERVYQHPMRMQTTKAAPSDVVSEAVDTSTLGYVTTATRAEGGRSERLTPDAADARPTLEVVGLRGGYGKLEVLHGVDVSATAGRITGIFGANGSGKSTLCSTVAGLIEAWDGDIYLEGELVNSASGADRTRRGIFVVTESRTIFPSMTVEENLYVALRSKASVESALDQSPELQPRRGTRAGMLSGGEQQLLAMAPALVTQPKVLVADEPCLGLAPLARDRILEVCQTLRDRGSALLLIEERPGDVFELADDVVFMHLGHVAWVREKPEVQPRELIDSYLAGKADVNPTIHVARMRAPSPEAM